MADKLRLHIDRQRLGDLIELDQYFAITYDNDARAMADVLANFVVGEDGQILPVEEGRKRLGKLSLNEFKVCRDAFIRGAEDAVVPPSSGAS